MSVLIASFLLLASAPPFRLEHAAVASPLAFDASPLDALREELHVTCGPERRTPRCSFTSTHILANPTDGELSIPDLRTLRASVASTRVENCRPSDATSRSRSETFLERWMTDRAPVAGTIPAKSECTLTVEGTITPGALGLLDVITPMHARHRVLSDPDAYRYGVRFVPASESAALTVDASAFRVEIAGLLATLHSRAPGFAAGGPFLGYGPSELDEEGETIRFRGGWEIGGPTRWLVWSASAESGDGEWVVAPALEAATPSVFPFVMVPSVSLGVGAPIRLGKERELGVRGIFAYQWPWVGLQTTVDWFHEDVRVTTIARLSF